MFVSLASKGNFDALLLNLVVIVGNQQPSLHSLSLSSYVPTFCSIVNLNEPAEQEAGPNSVGTHG